MGCVDCSGNRVNKSQRKSSLFSSRWNGERVNRQQQEKNKNVREVERRTGHNREKATEARGEIISRGNINVESYNQINNLHLSHPLKIRLHVELILM